MKKYRIIFSDIDGTLLTSKHDVSENTKLILKKLEQINIPFVLVSARMPKGIYKVQKEIEINSPIVCYSGGLIMDESGKSISSTGIDLKTAIKVKEYINSKWKDISTSCYSFDDWIVDSKTNEWIMQESNITSVEPIEGEISNVCKETNVVHKILCMGNPDKIDEMQIELSKKYKDLSIYKSKSTYLEIMDSKATKFSAINILCDLYNIDTKDAIAVGDNYNDMDMIKAAGMGVAMGNGPYEVKKISDDVTLTNDNDGVAEMIKKYFDFK